MRDFSRRWQYFVGKSEKAPSIKQRGYSPNPPAFSRQVLHAWRISSFCSSYSFLILWIISTLPEDMAKQQERQILLFISGQATVLSTSFSQITHSSAIALPFSGPFAFRLWIVFYYITKTAKMHEKIEIIERVLASKESHSGTGTGII